MVNVQAEHGYYAVEGEVLTLQGVVKPVPGQVFSELMSRAIQVTINRAQSERPGLLAMQLTLQWRHADNGEVAFATVFAWPQSCVLRYVPGPMPRGRHNPVFRLFEDDEAPDSSSSGFNVPDPDEPLQ